MDTLVLFNCLTCMLKSALTIPKQDNKLLGNGWHVYMLFSEL